MRFQPATLGPRIRAIVMIDVAEEEAGVGLVDDEPDVGAYPDRPETLVLRLVQFVEAEAGRRRIHLQVERGGFYGLLLIACQASKALRECVGDKECHRDTSGMRST